MLLARLHDTVLARELLVASVHLKAKAGAENDQLREQQVGGHTSFIPSSLRPASYMSIPQRVTCDADGVHAVMWADPTCMCRCSSS